MTDEDFFSKIRAISEDWHNSSGSHSDDLLGQIDEVLTAKDRIYRGWDLMVDQNGKEVRLAHGEVIPEGCRVKPSFVYTESPFDKADQDW